MITRLLICTDLDRTLIPKSKDARQSGHEDRLYIAREGFLHMDGNYSAGMLEGIVYYYPHIQSWM